VQKIISEQKQLNLRDKLRALPTVDYEKVARFKYAVFEAMFGSFKKTHIGTGSERENQFKAYLQLQGKKLVKYSLYESENNCFAKKYKRELLFYQYLQWLADQQLQRCQQQARESGMRLGLMRDLAIGAVAEGAEVINNRQLYSTNATVGAPPDPLAEAGQNWNLPAPDPVAMKANRYRNFIDLLRANMTHAGALRIDHVMGLMRLWWCLPADTGFIGAYVYYPFEDLLGILCLESHRHRCMVIGEDMGVVTDELRHAMADSAIYSNKLFYFQKNDNQEFKNLADYQPDSLLMVTNHDVPTLAGWWAGRDLDLHQSIGKQTDLVVARDQRTRDKKNLIEWLDALSLLPESWQIKNHKQKFDHALTAAILVACAASQSKLMLIQIDDLQLLEDPVNIPGTSLEYPNWRRKQNIDTAKLFTLPVIQQLLANVATARKQ
jgi:4-alpha-glucanotransferase